MKHIYIEGLGLVEGHFSGVGQYILGILRGIDEIIDDLQYQGKEAPKVTVIIPRNTVSKFRSFGFKHISYKRLPFSFKLMSFLWYRNMLPPIDIFCGKGTYIFTRFVGMPLAFSNAATVIYDLSFELHKEYSDDKNAKFLSLGIRNTLKRKNLKKIITISNNAKQEITKFYNLNPNDVAVATPAADPRIFYHRSNKEILRVKARYGISGDYILTLSNLEPRKNLSTVIESYCSLPKSITNHNALLLVGVNGWKTEKLFKEIINKVEQGFNIIRPTAYVTDEDKAAIISGARMLVYPSHYEGFGMPPLESLACGTPVISSNNSSLPEVVGKNGTMVSSHDPSELKLAMLEYFNKIESITKKAAVNGPIKARTFSWKKSAQIFLDVAKEIN